MSNKMGNSLVSSGSIAKLEQAVRQYNDRLFRNPYRETGYRMAHGLINLSENMTENLLSVIVPVYGNVNVDHLEACLLSLKRQRGVSLEIVLAEQTFDTEKYKSLAEKYAILYISDHLDENLSGRHFNSGRIRNVAIHKSNGQFVYASDSDILYYDPDYMAKIIRALCVSPYLVFEWPRMKHLVLEGQQGFYERFKETLIWNQIVPDLVSHGEWMYSYKDCPPFQFREIEYSGRPMILREADFKVYIHNPGASAGWEQRWMLALRHDGAIAARRSQIDAVGGYAESFYQWGYEDYDLQWKLGELFCLVPLENYPEFEVIHLDHEKGWFDKLLFERNGFLHWKRRERTIAGAIIADVLENESPYGLELKKRWRVDLSRNS